MIVDQWRVVKATIRVCIHWREGATQSPAASEASGPSLANWRSLADALALKVWKLDLTGQLVQSGMLA